VESIRIKDLMVPLDQYVCVSEEATLYEAVIALEEAQAKSMGTGSPHRAVLICDKKNKVVGKLGLLDVLRSLESRYSNVKDLKKVSGFGLTAEFMQSMMDKYDLWKAPLQDLCRKAASVKTGSLVAAPLEAEFIDETAGLDVAIHQMIMGHFQSLLVTSEGNIVGVLRLTDVYKEVADRIKACQI
jgi:CBS domain containing-hemolysin-like protein